MMSNFSHGHAKVFWEQLITAIEDIDDLSEDERFIHLISPWMRDITLDSSGLSGDDWREILGDYDGPLAKLSDILQAMRKMGFNINILTLDSADKLLPKTKRSWLDEECRMIDRLVGPERDDPLINVWKKIGVHSKVYIFPHSSLNGSVNLTNAGMFLNGENLTLSKNEEGTEYFQLRINAEASLSGSSTFYKDTSRDYQFTMPSEHSMDEEEAPLRENLEQIKPTFPNPQSSPESYTHPLEYALGELPNTGDDFLNDNEKDHIEKWVKIFETEMRQLVKSYYHLFGHTMNAWKPAVEAEGRKPKVLKREWHRHFVIHDNGTTFHDKAAKTISQGNFDATDFPSGILPDLQKLSVDEALLYGSFLDDTWRCIYGSHSNPMKDFAGANLMDQTLFFFTTQVLGLGKSVDERRVEIFWISLVDHYNAIKWMRDKLSHINPTISRRRGMECQVGLQKFEQRVFSPYSVFMS